jgi:hypothetical protein
MDKIKKVIKLNLPHQNFDTLSVAVLDFKTNKSQMVEAQVIEGEVHFLTPSLCFDLASVSKILINAFSYFLKPQKFTNELIQCLEHRAGLPSWAILSRADWRSMIQAYPIKADAETLYSDLSALRVMLELEKMGVDQKQLVQNVWSSETHFWKDLKNIENCVVTGERAGEQIVGEVHDPNSFNLNCFTSHAGVFSTLNGLSQTLFSFFQQTQAMQELKHNLAKYPHRFYRGFDRVLNPEDTLAGAGCSPSTAGHLGFTGTSVWIDFEKEIGHIILSNATQNYWYEKAGLNQIRRTIGQMVWAQEI